MVRRSSATSRGTTYWFQFFFLDSLVPSISSTHAQFFVWCLSSRKKHATREREKATMSRSCKSASAFSVFERYCEKKIALLKDAFSFEPPLSFSSKLSLRKGNSFCFVNCAIVAISTISILNVLSTLSRT